MWTWFTQSMLCIMMSFTKITPKHSISHQSDQIFSYSQQWLLYLLCRSGFCSFLKPPHPKQPSREEKEKGKATRWLLIHDSALKVSTSKSNCPASRRRGACPGPCSVTDQLWGVNAHFSQLSGTCDGGERIQRSTEVTALQISRAFEILNCVIKEGENTNFPKANNL